MAKLFTISPYLQGALQGLPIGTSPGLKGQIHANLSIATALANP
jgi:hypothetical protein